MFGPLHLFDYEPIAVLPSRFNALVERVVVLETLFHHGSHEIAHDGDKVLYCMCGVDQVAAHTAKIALAELEPLTGPIADHDEWLADHFTEFAAALDQHDCGDPTRNRIVGRD